MQTYAGQPVRQSDGHVFDARDSKTRSKSRTCSKDVDKGTQFADIATFFGFRTNPIDTGREQGSILELRHARTNVAIRKHDVQKSQGRHNNAVA